MTRPVLGYDSTSIPAVRIQAPASLRRRLAAFSFDYIVIAGYLALLTVVAIRVPWASSLFDSPLSGQATSFVLLTVPVVLYFALWERSGWAATPGKRALAIAVLRSDGRRLSGSRSLARTALKFVPWELAHTCIWRIPGWPSADAAPPAWVVAGLTMVWLLVLLNLVVAMRSERRQAVYDRIVDSVVYRAASS